MVSTLDWIDWSMFVSWLGSLSYVLGYSVSIQVTVSNKLMLGQPHDGLIIITSAPSRGELKYSQLLHATETTVSFGSMSHQAQMRFLRYNYHNNAILVLIRKYYLLSLIFRKPLFNRMDVWTVFWCVGITGESLRYMYLLLSPLV